MSNAPASTVLHGRMDAPRVSEQQAAQAIEAAAQAYRKSMKGSFRASTLINGPHAEKLRSLGLDPVRIASRVQQMLVADADAAAASAAAAAATGGQRAPGYLPHGFNPLMPSEQAASIHRQVIPPSLPSHGQAAPPASGGGSLSPRSLGLRAGASTSDVSAARSALFDAVGLSSAPVSPSTTAMPPHAPAGSGRRPPGPVGSTGGAPGGLAAALLSPALSTGGMSQRGSESAGRRGGGSLSHSLSRSSSEALRAGFEAALSSDRVGGVGGTGPGTGGFGSGAGAVSSGPDSQGISVGAPGAASPRRLLRFGTEGDEGHYASAYGAGTGTSSGSTMRALVTMPPTSSSPPPSSSDHGGR